MFGGLLIGNSIEIVDASDKRFIGLHGRILDETKNTLIVEDRGSRIVIPKSIVSFDLFEGSRKIQRLVGGDLIATPQERINKI